MTWRSIEDDPPPKDGTSILGYWSYVWPDIHCIQPIHYLHGRWLHDWDYSDGIDPTHWQPLPEPPDA